MLTLPVLCLVATTPYPSSAQVVHNMARKPKSPPAPTSVEPKVRSWLPPIMMPVDAPDILKKRKLTRKQFSKFTENIPLFMAGYMSGDVMTILQALIRLGDIEAIKLYFRMIGLEKNSPQNVINLHQNNNTMNINSGGPDRQIDTLVRQLDDRDRKKIIEAKPVALIE
jgi:hypothetical protein